MGSGIEEHIFEAALGMALEERPAYLGKACQNDPQLRQRVERPCSGRRSG